MQKKRAEFWRFEEDELHSTENLEEIFSHAKSRLHNSSSSLSCKSRDEIIKHPLKLRTDSTNQRPLKPKISTRDGNFLRTEITDPKTHQPKYSSYNYQRKSRICEKEENLISSSSYDSYKSNTWRPSSVEPNRLQKDFRLIKSRDSMKELEHLNGDIRSKIQELRQIMQTTSPRTQVPVQRTIIFWKLLKKNFRRSIIFWKLLKKLSEITYIINL